MPSYRTQFDSYYDNFIIRSSSTNNINPTSFHNYPQRPDSYQAYTSYQSNQPNNPKRNSLAKLNDFRRKVHQVIDLCTNQSQDVKTQFNQVVGQQRKIYDLLVENPSLLRKTVSQQSFPPLGTNPQQTIPYSQPVYNQPIKSQEIKTPYRPLKIQNVPQSHLYIPNLSQVGNKQNNYNPSVTHSKVLKPESVYVPFQDIQNAPSQNLQNSLNRLKASKHINLNEDALRLIEQIERKAYEQIERLRKQKLQLMQRLNNEIRNVNQQRQKNASLQNLLAKYTSGAQRVDNVAVNENSQYLQAQINRLQSELQTSNQINHNLRLELTNRGAGVPGIQQLLRQGQAIRQQTLRLLKVKEQVDGSNLQIQQFQRRLQAQRAQKQAALNQLRSLKQRVGGDKPNRPTEPSYGFQKSMTKSRPVQQGKSVGQYQDLVSQMKRITGF